VTRLFTAPDRLGGGRHADPHTLLNHRPAGARRRSDNEYGRAIVNSSAALVESHRTARRPATRGQRPDSARYRGGSRRPRREARDPPRRAVLGGSACTARTRSTVRGPGGHDPADAPHRRWACGEVAGMAGRRRRRIPARRHIPPRPDPARVSPRRRRSGCRDERPTGPQQRAALHAGRAGGRLSQGQAPPQLAETTAAQWAGSGFLWPRPG
jgi:hypothetical protein